MSDIPFGRAVELVTERSPQHGDFRIGLEAITKETGRLNFDLNVEYDGDGIAFHPGDVLFGKLRPNLAKAWLADRQGEAVGDFHVYRPRVAITTSRYLAYLVLSDPFLGPVIASVSGAKMPRADWSEVRNVKVWLPSAQEQEAIADYLDRETAQIDAFIAKNEELIALIIEHRSTVIDRLLSDSMQHADVVKLNWELSFLNGDRGSTYPSRDEFVESGVPFINAGHLVDGSLSYEHMNYVSPEKFAEMGGAKLKEDDLLFCLRGSVGKLGLFTGRETGALASSLVAMRPRTGRISMPYLAAVLESKRAQDLIDLAQTGSAQPNLSVEQLSQFRFPMPNANTQLETVNRIAEIRQRSTSSLATAQRAIELAKERRAALISAAVTGKIDVSKEASAI